MICPRYPLRLERVADRREDLVCFGHVIEVRYDEYDYFKAQIIEHVVLKGRKIERAEGDYEFTDWTALFAAVDSFYRSSGPSRIHSRGPWHPAEEERDSG